MKYLLLLAMLISFSSANAINIHRSNTNDAQLCTKLNQALSSPSSSNFSINIYGSWTYLDDCAIGVSSSAKNVTINANNASFTSRPTIDNVLFYFIQQGSDYSTNITWKGGLINTSNSHPINYPSSHNVGTAIHFTDLKNIIVDDITINGGVNTSVIRSGSNSNGSSYAHGGDCGICGVNNMSTIIKNSNFSGMADAAIYLGAGGGAISIHDNIFTSNNIGVVFKRNAYSADVRNNLFVRNVSGVIADNLGNVDSIRYITVVSNTFIKHISSAVRLKQVKYNATTYGNKIYGMGRIDSHQQESNVDAISYEGVKGSGLVRFNTIRPKSVPSSVIYKGTNYSETYYAPHQDSTSAVHVNSNQSSMQITANHIYDTLIGIKLSNSNGVLFHGNITNARDGVLLQSGSKNSKITAGIFSSYVGYREHYTNSGNFNNKYCAEHSDAYGGGIWAQPGNTDSRIRISNNNYKRYIGNIKQANVTSCGF